MSDIVTGTPAVVGFTNGYDRGYGHHGISDKDQMFAQTVEANERTRDVMASSRFESEHLRDAICSTNTAVEKIGAANQLATEKIGAANQITMEKIGAAAVLTAEKIGSAAVQATHDQSHLLALQLCNTEAKLAAQMAECCCEIKQEVNSVKATVLEVDARRVRDDLAQARMELTIAKSCCTTGNGNNGK